jgi:hypothetical protein
VVASGVGQTRATRGREEAAVDLRRKRDDKLVAACREEAAETTRLLLEILEGLERLPRPPQPSKLRLIRTTDG